MLVNRRVLDDTVGSEDDHREHRVFAEHMYKVRGVFVKKNNNNNKTESENVLFRYFF